MSFVVVPGAMSVAIGMGLCLKGAFIDALALNDIEQGMAEIAFGIGLCVVGIGLAKCDKRDKESRERINRLLKQNNK